MTVATLRAEEAQYLLPRFRRSNLFARDRSIMIRATTIVSSDGVNLVAVASLLQQSLRRMQLAGDGAAGGGDMRGELDTPTASARGH
jgi:hypothetical protein